MLVTNLGADMTGQLLNVTPVVRSDDVLEAVRGPASFRVVEEVVVARGHSRGGWAARGLRAAFRGLLQLVGLAATFVLTIGRFLLGLVMILATAAALLLLIATWVTGEKNGYNWFAVSAAIAFGAFVAMFLASRFQLWAQGVTGLRPRA